MTPPRSVGVVETAVPIGEDKEAAGCLPKEAAGIAIGMFVLASDDDIVKGTHFVR